MHVEPVSDGSTLYLVEPFRLCATCYEEDTGPVVALDLATGMRRWTTEAPDVIRWNSLAVAEGMVVGSGTSCTIAYDAATGAERWRHCLLGPYGPPVVAGPYVYETSLEWVQQLNLSDGTETGFNFRNDYQLPLLTVGEHRVISSSNVYDDITRDVLWSDWTPADRTIRDGVVYTRRYDDGTLHAFDAVDGDELWSVTLDCSSPVSPPTVDADTIYLQACGEVLALRRADGSERWSFVDEANGGSEDRLTLAGGFLYFTNAGTALYVVDATSGEVVRTIPLGTTPGSNVGVGPPIVANGHVVVAGEYGLEVFAAS